MASYTICVCPSCGWQTDLDECPNCGSATEVVEVVRRAVADELAVALETTWDKARFPDLRSAALTKYREATTSVPA